MNSPFFLFERSISEMPRLSLQQKPQSFTRNALDGSFSSVNLQKNPEPCGSGSDFPIGDVVGYCTETALLL